MEQESEHSRKFKKSLNSAKHSIDEKIDRIEKRLLIDDNEDNLIDIDIDSFHVFLTAIVTVPHPTLKKKLVSIGCIFLYLIYILCFIGLLCRLLSYVKNPSICTDDNACSNYAYCIVKYDDHYMTYDYLLQNYVQPKMATGKELPLSLQHSLLSGYCVYQKEYTEIDSTLTILGRYNVKDDTSKSFDSKYYINGIYETALNKEFQAIQSFLVNSGTLKDQWQYTNQGFMFAINKFPITLIKAFIVVVFIMYLLTSIRKIYASIRILYNHDIKYIVAIVAIYLTAEKIICWTQGIAPYRGSYIYNNGVYDVWGMTVLLSVVLILPLLILFIMTLVTHSNLVDYQNFQQRFYNPVQRQVSMVVTILSIQLIFFIVLLYIAATMDFITQTYNLLQIFFNTFGLVVMFDLDTTVLKYFISNQTINETRKELSDYLGTLENHRGHLIYPDEANNQSPEGSSNTENPNSLYYTEENLLKKSQRELYKQKYESKLKAFEPYLNNNIIIFWSIVCYCYLYSFYNRLDWLVKPISQSLMYNFSISWLDILDYLVFYFVFYGDYGLWRIYIFISNANTGSRYNNTLMILRRIAIELFRFYIYFMAFYMFKYFVACVFYKINVYTMVGESDQYFQKGFEF